MAILNYQRVAQNLKISQTWGQLWWFHVIPQIPSPQWSRSELLITYPGFTKLETPTMHHFLVQLSRENINRLYGLSMIGSLASPFKRFRKRLLLLVLSMSAVESRPFPDLDVVRPQKKRTRGSVERKMNQHKTTMNLSATNLKSNNPAIAQFNHLPKTI